MSTKTSKTSRASKIIRKSKKSATAQQQVTSFPITNVILIFVGIILAFASFTLRDETTVLRNNIKQKIIQADAGEVKAANEGKLVAVSGKIFGDSVQRDPIFGISKSTIKMKRVVETYQWLKDCEDGHCDYLKVWSEDVISSEGYDAGYENETTAPYESTEYVSDSVALGEYKLSEKLINDLTYDTTMGPDELVKAYSGNYRFDGEYITNSTDSNNPKIGDFRISYKYVKDKDVTVIAKQAEGGFTAFRTDNKAEVYEIKEGAQTAEDYIASMSTKESPASIAVLIIGIVFIFFGFSASIFTLIRRQA